ncbi:MAG: circadian clock KaiB family protein [Archangium sp.]|nr:circadian clock KaiB family protein [Archangium sp.]
MSAPTTKRKPRSPKASSPRPRAPPRPIALRLYVAGASPNSLAAIHNLKSIHARIDGARFEVEMVDVLREPDRGLADGILVTPTLVRVWPLPRCRVLGDLRDVELVVRCLGLE